METVAFGNAVMGFVDLHPTEQKRDPYPNRKEKDGDKNVHNIYRHEKTSDSRQTNLCFNP